MDIKYLTGARFLVWGEQGTKRRFIKWEHPDLGSPVTFLLEEQHVSQLLDALRRKLPPAAHTPTSRVQ